MVNSKGYLERQQHEAESTHTHFSKRKFVDNRLAEKYNFAYVRREIEQEDRLFIQGMTSDCQLKMLVIDKASGTVMVSKDLGQTSICEKPHSSNMVLVDSSIYLAYWSLIGWTIYDSPTYNLVICKWDFAKDTFQYYPIASIERNDHTTLSMAINNEVLGLAYYECDDSNLLKMYSRVRFILIDSSDLSVKKSFWVSR